MVSTDARSWLCPQSRCGKMLPFSHIKPNLTVFHINTNVFPVLAPVTDPDFTLTKSHLYHHLTQLRSSRNRKLIWCELSLLFDDISPAGFDFSCAPLGTQQCEVHPWFSLDSVDLGPITQPSFCFRSSSVTERLSACCLPSWRNEAQLFLMRTAEQTG